MRGEVNDSVFHHTTRAAWSIRRDHQVFSLGEREHLPNRSCAAATAGTAYGLNADGVEDIGHHGAVVILADQGGHIDGLPAEGGGENRIVPDAEQ